MAPKVVAIDIDIAPPDLTSADDQFPESDIVHAVEQLLGKGISVVAVSYPRLVGDPGDLQKWRRWLCARANRVQPLDQSSTLSAEDHGVSPPGGGRVGTLYWASAELFGQGRVRSLIRSYQPEVAKKLFYANQELLPLGWVVATAAGLGGKHQERLSHYANACSQAFQVRTEPPPDCEASRSCPLPEAEGFINYFTALPDTVDLEERSKIVEYATQLKGKAVVLGVRSFGNIDLHLTPLDMHTGAFVHSVVAASVMDGLRDHHALAWAIDIALGYGFVVLFLAAQRVRHGFEHRHEKAEAMNRLLALLAPFVPLATASLFLTYFAPTIAREGLWLNPLPMLFGLLLHLYVEMVHGGHADIRCSECLRLRVRIRRLWNGLARWRAAARFFLLPLRNGDLLVRWLWRATLFCVVLAALCFLVFPQGGHAP